MLGLIYCAKNLINNKIYIGQTIQTLNRRKSCHFSTAASGDNLYFHKALRKYGKENFEWSVLEEVDLETLDELKSKLNELEIWYIKKFNSNNSLFGYNLTSGGDAHYEQSINFWNSEAGNARKELLSKQRTEFWAAEVNRKNHQAWMNNFYKSDVGIAQAKRHSDWMLDYYNGENARLNKAKTSKWFVKATSPENKIIIFISSKEPNIYFNRDIGLRIMLHNIGDIWVPSKRSKYLYGWKFEAIEKDEQLIKLL